MVERYRPNEASKETSKEDYVGYKNPPTHTRFKKGQSGNPRGRPRSEQALLALLADELRSTVTITENGRPLKANKALLIVKQAVNKAAKGEDLRSLAFLLKNAEALQRIAKTSTKKHPFEKVDISKLTLNEKMQALKEAIARSKSVDEY